MISNVQITQIQLAHAAGLLDGAIAHSAGVSLSTVKRVRKNLGLETNSVTALRGRQGEKVAAQAARTRGLKVEWRTHDTAKHDLVVSGLRVDVKTAMQQPDGTWKYRLPKIRASFGHQYEYPKDYAADCEVIVLCCLYLDGRTPDLYMLSSTALPGTVRIIPGTSHLAALEDWSMLAVPLPLHLPPLLPLSA